MRRNKKKNNKRGKPLFDEIMPFYADCREYCIKAGYMWEIDSVQNRYWKDMDVPGFLEAYVFCVFNVRMKNQIAQKMFDKFCESGCDLNTIGHPHKRKAIERGIDHCGEWMAQLRNFSTDEERVEFLDTLPMIGEVTKFHLARNLGMDVAKPDVHLVRLMHRFQFDDVQAMCKYVAGISGDRIGTVDVVFWRASNLGFSGVVG